ncbi:MAG: GGDEF domain-containing protein, partial [Caldimicrobium sp.]
GISYTEIDYTKEIAIEAVLSSLLNVIGSVKAIHKYTKELEFYATRDSLTSLYNQRVFWELLTYEIERAKRFNYKFAVLLLDLDNFKVINDTYGHLFGDQFLKEMASLLENNKRKGDILARYGGDEFVFILPLCDLSQAVSVAERIRENLKVYKIKAPDGKELSITTTISIVIFPDHAETPKDLFAIADTLLYKS